MENMWENNSSVNIRFVAKTSDIRNFSQNIRSDVNTSEVATLAENRMESWRREMSIAVVYRIRILESNRPGYQELFGFGMDIVSIATGSGLSKWKNFGHAKNLIWNNSCTMEKHDISKSY